MEVEITPGSGINPHKTLPTIAVVVAAYNVATYLPLCLSSIQKQNYPNLQVIIVDDGSTDSTGSIADQWAEGYKFAQVIHQSNQGLSGARNAALEHVTAPLVTFVDGDDALHPDALSTLYQLMTDCEADLAVGLLKEVYDSEMGHFMETPLKVAKSEVFTPDEAIDSVFYREKIHNSACAKLYRSEIFRVLRFPEGMLYEDLAIAYPVLRSCTRIAFSPIDIYGYRQREGSIIHTFNQARFHVIDHLEKLEAEMAVNDKAHLPAVRFRLVRACINMLALAPKREFSQQICRCLEHLHRLRASVLVDVHASWSTRLTLLFSYITGLYGLHLLLQIAYKLKK